MDVLQGEVPAEFKDQSEDLPGAGEAGRVGGRAPTDASDVGVRPQVEEHRYDFRFPGVGRHEERGLTLRVEGLNVHSWN